MIRSLHFGSTLFAAAFVALTALGVMSLGGSANASTAPPETCGKYSDPNPCGLICTGGKDCPLKVGCDCDP